MLAVGLVVGLQQFDGIEPLLFVAVEIKAVDFYVGHVGVVRINDALVFFFEYPILAAEIIFVNFADPYSLAGSFVGVGGADTFQR